MTALILALGLPAGTASQGGVTAQWWFEESALVLYLEAPTTGWVAAGFNPTPTLAGSRLAMTAVRDGTPVAEEHLATPPDHPLQHTLVVRAAEEQGGRTRVVVEVPRQPTTQGALTLNPGVACGLTLAYSTSDDFDHHSAWRGLVEVAL